ncbi:MAG: hypothetical protein DRP97_00520 [Candidatus Latescibacterota bacterium]|nr:MAG: hypothetical protein DRP97_00520 [Candidatus Latescibacterota bacterium]
MTRTPKYKIWDGKTMHQSDNIQLQFSTDGWIALPYGANAEIIHNPIMLEFTGLKDENGKMIFEGDVLKYEREKKKIGIVNYNNKYVCYMFGNDEIGDNIFNIEILGNIYENPELLKEEK